jgi:hypothetical protein
MNLNKLRGKLTECGINYEKAGKYIGRSRTSFSNRINSKKPFTQSEISKLKKLLNLTNDEVAEIFLD